MVLLSRLVGSSLLVALGLGVVLGLVHLVGDGITGSGDTEKKAMLVSDDQVRAAKMSEAYRVPMPALESLATFLLASLEAPEVAPVEEEMSVTVLRM